MLKSYAPAKDNCNDKHVKRIFYNSTLGQTDSEYPFHSVPSTADVKNLRINLALYKEKLQNQFQKCREFLKEKSHSSSSSTVLKEIILDNMSKTRKRKLLGRLKNMGLKIKEAVGEDETVVVVDLSPFSANRDALNYLMRFIEKETERRDKTEKVSRNNSLYSKRKHERNNSGKVKLDTIPNYKSFENKKRSDKINTVHRPKANDKHEETYDYYSATIEPHTYEPGPSFCLREINTQQFTSSADNNQTTRNNKTIPYEEIQKKLNQYIKNEKKSSLPGQAYIITSSTLQNLFRKNLPSKEKIPNKKQGKKMKKKNQIFKLFNTMRNFFLNREKIRKKNKKKEKEIGNGLDCPVIAYPVITETDNYQCIRKGKHISFNKSVIYINKTVNGSVEEENSSPKLNIINEKPAIVWGKSISVESKKELELILKHLTNQQQTSINKLDDQKSDTDCKRNIKGYTGNEFEEILNQQLVIKEMIDSIQKTLKRCETISRTLTDNVEKECCDKKCLTDSSEKRDINKQYKCSDNWSEKATLSCGSTFFGNNSISDSMTNIKSTGCWCPDLFCDKIKTICCYLTAKSKNDTIIIQDELQNHRREIYRLNKMLDLHLQDHPSKI